MFENESFELNFKKISNSVFLQVTTDMSITEMVQALEQGKENLFTQDHRKAVTNKVGS